MPSYFDWPIFTCFGNMCRAIRLLDAVSFSGTVLRTPRVARPGINRASFSEHHEVLLVEPLASVPFTLFTEMPRFIQTWLGLKYGPSIILSRVLQDFALSDPLMGSVLRDTGW